MSPEEKKAKIFQWWASDQGFYTMKEIEKIA